MYDLEKNIDEYSEELFVDLGLTTWSEEQKADTYARIQEHLHRVVIETLRPSLDPEELNKIREALEQEDYHGLRKILKKYPEHKNALEEKIDKEFQKLKLTISEELKHAEKSRPDSSSGGGAVEGTVS